jgi:hypothetical protein
MPQHRGDGAGSGADGWCGRDAIHSAHGVRGGDPAVVGRRRGEELFRRGNLSSDSISGLALALPHESGFPQTGLSRRVLRTGSSQGGDSGSLVGDQWRGRRRINDRRRGDWRGRVLRTGNPRRRGICHSRKDRCGARRGEGPSGGNGPCPPRRPEHSSSGRRDGGGSTRRRGPYSGREGRELGIHGRREDPGALAALGGVWSGGTEAGLAGAGTWALLAGAARLLAALAWDRGRKGGAGRAERRSGGAPLGAARQRQGGAGRAARRGAPGGRGPWRAWHLALAAPLGATAAAGKGGGGCTGKGGGNPSSIPCLR